MTHRTYKGRNIDMNSFRAKNEKTVAVGNMGVNAKGDRLVNGKVVESSNHRVRKQVNIPTPTKDVSLKPDTAEDDVLPNESKSRRTQVKKPTKTEAKAPVEKELDNGDIVIDDE